MSSFLSPIPKQEFSYVFQILDAAFPPQEKRTKQEQERLLDDPHYHLYVHRKGENIVAFLAFWEFDQFRFLEHFAVEKTCRGGGLGRTLLEDFQHMSQKPICLEVEPGDHELARRRIGFYKRSRFHLNEFAYEQPALQADQGPIPLQIMSYPSPLTLQEFQNFRQTVYHHVYHVR